MAFKITSTNATSKDVIHEINMAEIIMKQEQCYANRIGKQYGDFVVREVWYDWDNRKQMWKMECSKCGRILITASGREYAKGRAKGICGCEKRAERERVAERMAEVRARIEREKVDRIESENDKWQYKTFDTWIVLKVGPSLKTWVVQCTKCGKTAVRSASKMKDGTAPKCACNSTQPLGNYHDSEWIGKQYGFLKILRYENRHFTCECVCGRETRVKPTHLFRGMVKTCGSKECLTYGFIHGFGYSKERIYVVWSGMMNRCYNPKCKGYKTYGARGITVCPEWQSFYNFRDWAYSTGYDETAKKGDCTIDRINNDGNYEPSNCRWADAKTQANNQHPKWTFTPKSPEAPHKRRIQWTIDGVTKDAIDWCKEYGVSKQFVDYRVKVIGMTPYEALTTPKRTDGRPLKKAQ